MATRRTLKQKQNAHHTPYLTWSPTTSGSEAKTVKREIKSSNSSSHENSLNSNYSDVMAKDGHIGTMKRDITKTLAITCLILGLEVVLYWALQG